MTVVASAARIGVRAIGLMWLATGAAFVFLARPVVVAVGWWYRAGVLANAVVFAIAVAVHLQATA